MKCFFFGNVGGKVLVFFWFYSIVVNTSDVGGIYVNSGVN